MSELDAEILALVIHRLVFGDSDGKGAASNQTGHYVCHAETARGMDEGLSLDDICASLHLPDELAAKPYLQEFYGKLEWSARAFATGTLGWYGW